MTSEVLGDGRRASALLLLDLVRDFVVMSGRFIAGAGDFMKKDCTDLIRRIALLLHLAEDIINFSGGEKLEELKETASSRYDTVNASSLDCLSEVVGAIQGAKRLVYAASTFSGKVDSSATDGATTILVFQFQQVTTRLETALANLPYDHFCISDEVQEQVDLVRAQLSRAAKEYESMSELADEKLHVRGSVKWKVDNDVKNMHTVDDEIAVAVAGLQHCSRNRDAELRSQKANLIGLQHCSRNRDAELWSQKANLIPNPKIKDDKPANKGSKQPMTTFSCGKEDIVDCFGEDGEDSGEDGEDSGAEEDSGEDGEDSGEDGEDSGAEEDSGEDGEDSGDEEDSGEDGEDSGDEEFQFLKENAAHILLLRQRAIEASKKGIGIGQIPGPPTGNGKMNNSHNNINKSDNGKKVDQNPQMGIKNTPSVIDQKTMAALRMNNAQYFSSNGGSINLGETRRGGNNDLNSMMNIAGFNGNLGNVSTPSSPGVSSNTSQGHQLQQNNSYGYGGYGNQSSSSTSSLSGFPMSGQYQPSTNMTGGYNNQYQLPLANMNMNILTRHAMNQQPQMIYNRDQLVPSNTGYYTSSPVNKPSYPHHYPDHSNTFTIDMFSDENPSSSCSIM